MHHPHSKHEPENTFWTRAPFDALGAARDRTLRTPCEENAAALAAFFDGESADAETLRAARHLEECARCRELLQSWQRTRALLLSTPPAVAPPLLLPRVLAALRLIALCDPRENAASSDAAPSFLAAPRDIAPPPEMMRDILRATSNLDVSGAAASRAFAETHSSRHIAPRSLRAGRAASRVLALAVPACLVLVAFSLQPNAPEETLPSAPALLRPRAATPPRASSSVQPNRKSAVIAPAKSAAAKNPVASTRAVAPSVSHVAPEPVAPIETEFVAPAIAPRTSPAPDFLETDVSVARDNAPRATKIVSVRAAAPRSELMNLSVTTGKFMAISLTKNAKNSVATAIARAPQSMKIAPIFSRRAASTAPRLTFGAPVAAARVRLATLRSASIFNDRGHGIAPRATRPEADARSAAGLVTADFRSERTATSVMAHVVSTGAPRLAFAAPTTEIANDSGDALDEMRAATNSYRAALDAESDGSDGNI